MLGLLLLTSALFLYHRRHYYLSLMIFFTLLCNGFQIIPITYITAGTPVDKGSDFAIIFIIVVTITNFKYVLRNSLAIQLFRICVYFGLFLIIDAVYSYYLIHNSLVNIIQVFRLYLFLFSFAIFLKVPKDILAKTVKSLSIIVIFQSLLFLLQIVTGQLLLLSSTGTEQVNITLTSGYSRFYNTPAFLTPALFYFLYAFKFKVRLTNIITIVILLATVVGPLHRSYIIGLLVAISVYVFLSRSASKRILVFTTISIILYVMSFIDIIGNRMNEAIDDIETTFSTRLSIQTIDTHENTSLYRAAHVIERYEYIIRKPFGWLFGIGLMSDNSKLSTNLPFQIGLLSEQSGLIAKIDTADLIYSPLILNLGIVGTIFYLYIFLKILYFFYTNIKVKYAVVGFLTVLTSFLISMAGIEMLSITFRTMTMMLIVIVLKDISITKNSTTAHLLNSNSKMMFDTFNK